MHPLQGVWNLPHKYHLYLILWFKIWVIFFNFISRCSPNSKGWRTLVKIQIIYFHKCHLYLILSKFVLFTSTQKVVKLVNPNSSVNLPWERTRFPFLFFIKQLSRGEICVANLKALDCRLKVKQYINAIVQWLTTCKWQIKL